LEDTPVVDSKGSAYLPVAVQIHLENALRVGGCEQRVL